MTSSEFVRVAPELGLDRLFDYRIPEALQGRIRLGQRLRVPWGRREILAYAVEFPHQPEVEKVRDVAEVAGERPLIPSGLCQLARWMADYYACDLAAALRTILPGPVRSHEGGGKMAWWITAATGKEELAARVLKGGQGAGQGVGLFDGTPRRVAHGLGAGKRNRHSGLEGVGGPGPG